MVALITAALAEEAKRRKAQPGYPAIGRMKGVAELRGIIAALSHGKLGSIAG
jgi:mannonate dehydratase